MVPIFLIFNFLIYTNAYNILVYSPSFGGSHTNFMARIADTLSDAGHNVTFFVPVVDRARRHQLGVKSTKDVIMVETEQEVAEHDHSWVDSTADRLWRAELNSGNIGELFSDFTQAMNRSCHSFLQQKDLFQKMKHRNFHVGIFEPLTVCGLGFMYGLGIKNIITASSEVFYDPIIEVIGEPMDLSYIPPLLSTSDYSKELSLSDRVEDYRLTEAYKYWTFEKFDMEMQTYRKYLGDQIPDWRELIRLAPLHLVNSNPYVDFPRVVTQKTVSIGGIQVDYDAIKSEKLPEEWNKILDERPYSMLISFGSVVRSMDMPEEWRSGLLSAIKSQPNVTFIWKYEDDDISWASTASNIHFSKWVPQTALLTDSRLTAFMTHGGLGSTNELAHLGKPAIMVPIFVDQFRNSNMLARHGGVLVYRKQDLEDSDKLKNAMKSILYDEKYQKSSKILAELLQNQPLKPKEQVVRHVEFVARFGPFPKMNIEKKNLLNIHFVIAIPYLAIGLTVIGLLVMLYRLRLTSKIVKIE